MSVFHGHQCAFQAHIPELGLPFRRAGLFHLSLQKRSAAINKRGACAKSVGQVNIFQIFLSSSDSLSDAFLRRSGPSPLNKG